MCEWQNSEHIGSNHQRQHLTWNHHHFRLIESLFIFGCRGISSPDGKLLKRIQTQRDRCMHKYNRKYLESFKDLFASKRHGQNTLRLLLRSVLHSEKYPRQFAGPFLKFLGLIWEVYTPSYTPTEEDKENYKRNVQARPFVVAVTEKKPRAC